MEHEFINSMIPSQLRDGQDLTENGKASKLQRGDI